MNILIHQDGQQRGPFTLEEVQGKLMSGEVRSSDLAWIEGWADWQPLSTISGLRSPSTPPPVPPPPLPGGPPYFRYEDVPFFRRQWFFWLTYFIFNPAALIILISGDVYYVKKGEVKPFGMANRIVAGVLAFFLIFKITTAVVSQ